MNITFKYKRPDGAEINYDLTDYVVWLCTHGKRAEEIMDLLLTHEREPSPRKRALLRHLLAVTLESCEKSL